MCKKLAEPCFFFFLEEPSRDQIFRVFAEPFLIGPWRGLEVIQLRAEGINFNWVLVVLVGGCMDPKVG